MSAFALTPHHFWREGNERRYVIKEKKRRHFKQVDSLEVCAQSRCTQDQAEQGLLLRRLFRGSV